MRNAPMASLLHGRPFCKIKGSKIYPAKYWHVCHKFPCWPTNVAVYEAKSRLLADMLRSSRETRSAS